MSFHFTSSSRALLLACSLSFAVSIPAHAEPKAKSKDAAKDAVAESAKEEAPTLADYKEASMAILDNMDATADLLETVTDKKSAKIAAAKLTKAGKELEALFKSVNGMGKASPKIEKELNSDKELADHGKEVAEHFQTAATGLTELEDKEAAALVGPALTAYGKIAQSAGGEAEAEAEADVPTGPATVEGAKKVTNGILDNMDHAAEILESVTDKESAQAAIADLKKAGAELKSLFAKAKAMGDLPAEEKKTLDADEEIAQKGAEVAKRFEAAANALTKLEDKEATVLVAPALMEYGKIAQSGQQTPAEEAPPTKGKKAKP